MRVWFVFCFTILKPVSGECGFYGLIYYGRLLTFVGLRINSISVDNYVLCAVIKEYVVALKVHEDL